MVWYLEAKAPFQQGTGSSCSTKTRGFHSLRLSEEPLRRNTSKGTPYRSRCGKRSWWVQLRVVGTPGTVCFVMFQYSGPFLGNHFLISFSKQLRSTSLISWPRKELVFKCVNDWSSKGRLPWTEKHGIWQWWWWIEGVVSGEQMVFRK